jgi:hypothetical protein
MVVGGNCSRDSSFKDLHRSRILPGKAVAGRNLRRERLAENPTSHLNGDLVLNSKWLVAEN